MPLRKYMDTEKEIEEAIKKESIAKYYRQIIMIVDDMAHNVSRIEFGKVGHKKYLMEWKKQLALLRNYSRETRIIAEGYRKHKINQHILKRKELKKQYDKILRDEEL